MNPARLADLQRQRVLVREQLAWFDREIAAASGLESTLGEIADRPTAAPVAPAPEAAVDLEAYRPDPASAANEARRGCLLYACAALILGALVLTLVYFARYRDRPVIRSDAQKSPATQKLSSPTLSPPAPRK